MLLMPCVRARYQPQHSNGFAEMALFPELRSLRLRLDDPPVMLHLAQSLSALSALTLLELARSFSATSYSPAFGACAIPSLAAPGTPIELLACDCAGPCTWMSAACSPDRGTIRGPCVAHLLGLLRQRASSVTCRRCSS